MIVLNPQATIYDAVRAMADNHVGAVLVAEQQRVVGIVTDRDLALEGLASGLDPTDTSVGGVMSSNVVTCDVDDDLDDVTNLMCEFGIRRVPVTEEGRPVGIVTFDDLVSGEQVGLERLRAIVVAQLTVAAPAKPAGDLHPRSQRGPAGPARAFARRQARADQTYDRIVRTIAGDAGLDKSRAERAVPLAVCMICRRLTPQEARHLAAQLPSKLQPVLERCFDGPDRSVTPEVMKEELRRAIGVDDERAASTLRAVGRSLVESVSAGQIEDVRGQLPRAMRDLFPALPSGSPAA